MWRRWGWGREQAQGWRFWSFEKSGSADLVQTCINSLCATELAPCLAFPSLLFMKMWLMPWSSLPLFLCETHSTSLVRAGRQRQVAWVGRGWHLQRLNSHQGMCVRDFLFFRVTEEGSDMGNNPKPQEKNYKNHLFLHCFPPLSKPRGSSTEYLTI